MSIAIAKLRYTGLKSVGNQLRKMHIQAIKMRWGRGDNYSYLVTDEATKESTIIDPAEPNEVLPDLKKAINSGIKLTSIINTHHHYDHAGGNEELLKSFPGLPIIAGKDSPLVTTTPSHNSKFKIGSIDVTALHTPCHTQDSICYFFEDKAKNQKVVFTGDTLFIAGCGRFFEGTAQEMADALVSTLGSLPNDTIVYPGHEYTVSNLKFVKTVLNNEAVRKLEDFTSKNEITTGIFTIQDEKSYNPFMMIDSPVIKQAVGLQDRIEVMAKLRELKNKM